MREQSERASVDIEDSTSGTSDSEELLVLSAISYVINFPIFTEVLFAYWSADQVSGINNLGDSKSPQKRVSKTFVRKIRPSSIVFIVNKKFSDDIVVTFAVKRYTLQHSLVFVLSFSASL